MCRSNNQSLKNQRFKPSGCKDINLVRSSEIKCLKEMFGKVNEILFFVHYCSTKILRNRNGNYWPLIYQCYNWIYLITSKRAQRCPCKKSFELFFILKPLSVRKKFQPIRSSHLAGQREHIYECLVLLYRWKLILGFRSSFQ